MSLNTTNFTAQSVYFTTLEDTNAKHLVTQKTFAGKQIGRIATVAALTAVVAVGKLVALGRVQKGEYLLAGGVIAPSAGGGTATVDLVIADEQGNVLQTLASAVSVVAATNATLFAQTSTVNFKEATYTGVLALKVNGSQLPIGWTATVIQPSLID